MAYKISDDCIACGTCASECPVEAISEKDGKYVINADECIVHRMRRMRRRMPCRSSEAGRIIPTVQPKAWGENGGFPVLSHLFFR